MCFFIQVFYLSKFYLVCNLFGFIKVLQLEKKYCNRYIQKIVFMLVIVNKVILVLESSLLWL